MQPTPAELVTVGERVRALRKCLDLTQEELAEAGALSRDEVSRIETGRNHATSAGVRQKLALGFGLSLDDTYALLDGKLGIAGAAAAVARGRRARARQKTRAAAAGKL